MGTQVLRDQKILFDGYNLTGRMNSVNVNAEREAKDCTVFNLDTRKNLAGLKVATIGGAGFWDAEPDAALFAAMGADGKLVSVANGGAALSPVYMLSCTVGRYVYDGQTGEIFAWSLEVAARDALLRGLLVENETGFAATANGTARQLGAVAAGKRFYSGIHVLGVSGTDPTLDVVWKSDAANNFAGAETTRLSMTQLTGIGGQLASVAGAITDTWWRPEITLGGTDDPTFDFILFTAIQ